MELLIVGLGYCGAELARRALRAGHSVWAVRRGAEFPRGVRGLSLDLAEPEVDLTPLPTTIDRIVYAVGADAHDAASYERAYVTGLGRVITHYEQALAQHARLLFTSSTAVYGESSGWLDESSPAEADTFSARVLRRAEQQAQAAGGCVLRLGGIYGPGRASLIGRIQRGEINPESAPDRFTNRIHRDDVAGALLHLCERPEIASLYLGVDEDPAPLREVVGWLQAELGSRGLALPTASPAPGSRARTASPAPGSRARTVASKRCSSALLRAHDYQFRFPTFREGYAELLSRAENEQTPSGSPG